MSKKAENYAILDRSTHYSYCELLSPTLAVLFMVEDEEYLNCPISELGEIFKPHESPDDADIEVMRDHSKQ